MAQALFGIIPPAIGIGLANYFSKKSRAQTGINNEIFTGDDNEWLVQYCKERLKSSYFDYFIFGHRHLPLNIQLTETSNYVNLGDWIQYNSYAVFDGNSLTLDYYKNK
jgi:UDP-2,3-diacylglucosamine hydrolase